MDLTLGLPDNLQPAMDDGRLDFYFQNTMPDNSDYRAAAFYDDNVDGIPLYHPGEMLLIKAEAYARQGDLSNAISELNNVLTKSTDALGIGADLSTYSGAMEQDEVLDAIYSNRATELMMSGLRLEDSRRFNRPQSERNRDYYPYPNSERDNNPNTPADPSR